LTIRQLDHPLSELEQTGGGWWPSPHSTRADRDLAFDSVIVIWDPRVVDEYTGTRQWIGTAAGLAPNRSSGQAYVAIIIEATGYGHRNVFKHEWGHSILSYFEAIGVSPKPTVSNHTTSGQYVHWPTGENYLWVDETDANPIPNSIYNNESGFTHDYYSGTVATVDQPLRRLGITPEAWTWGGPVTKPGMQSSPPPAITCSGNITVARRPGTCLQWVWLTPPTAADACDLEFSPVSTRSDGQQWYAPYQCGQTVVTWTVTNSENQTSTCQQVVTVIDEEPPIFVNVPPPVTVNTGPEATSCGVVVEDSRLGATSPGANPVVLDPTGDVYNPSSPVRNDIISTSATFDRESLTFNVRFADTIYPPSSHDQRSLMGFIEIDTDQNPATGWPLALNSMGPPDMNLGPDFQINLFSELSRPGFVELAMRRDGTAADDSPVGIVPIVFTSNSFSITVPLAMLGRDNGLVNYGVGIWMVNSQPADRAPNGPVPATSVPVPAIMAIDDCMAVTISRSGVPANNVFPVGQTLITYTATDNAGNETSVTQSVTVIDNTSPVISNPVASPSTLWPPNGEMVDVTVNYQAADNCGVLGTKLIVSSNDPDAADWEVLDAHRVRLRAKRTARSRARLYTITIIAEDVHGNLSRQNVTVTVPHSHGKGG
ncbi:MAG TPA: HYR domain-containing protein, partial [Pyrinomonadaceae bacterium]|nr:HYR domain-containing protein [Pyrinomonadaceae bacterium]